MLRYLSLILLGSLLFDAQHSDGGETRPPNIVLCMGDDHGWEETGYNGHPHLKTPVLDEMAQKGLRFNRFYSGHPSCSPTRGSVITGRHPNRYGTFAPNWSLRPEEISIAQILRDAGYRTAHFGKWHLGPVKKSSPTSPGAMGFSHWLSHDNFFELNPSFSEDGEAPRVFQGESSEIIVDRALKFIKSAQASNTPFFIVIWFGSPHEPYSGLAEDLAIYDDLPAKYSDRKVKLTSNETGKSVQRPLGEVLRERYAEITAMDRAMGQLRIGLKEQGVRDDTVLWYCGDNGTPSSGLLKSPLKGRKGQVYEGGVRVPGVLEWPSKITHPLQTDHVAVTSDMLPTLCALADIKLPNRTLDGIDLTAVFEGEDSRSEPIFFWNFNTRSLAKSPKPWISGELQQGTTPLVKLMNGKPTRTFKNVHLDQITESNYTGPRAITTQKYKLILDQSSSDQVELYDLVNDIGETQNLAASKPKIDAQLQRAMHQWQTSVLQSLTGGDY
ncbi:MAG: sulfatase-like hydrolase/transferase [Rubripirellula sp.]|nr:sulfatase-like hydrolase/transferase [Rubripirellula sp.]